MDDIKIVRVTVGEIKNGWDDASLRKYLNGRNEAQVNLIDPRYEGRRKKPIEQNHKYNPHRWRD